jgi:hypothetical protein
MKKTHKYQTHLHIIHNPYSITFLIRTLVLEGKWFDVHNFKNKYRKDTCSKEIKLYAQNVIIILGSTMNTIGIGGGMCGHILSMRIFTLINEQENSHALQRL